MNEASPTPAAAGSASAPVRDVPALPTNAGSGAALPVHVPGPVGKLLHRAHRWLNVRAVRYAVGTEADASVKLDQHQLNDMHMRYPRAGDYWREKSQPVLVVVGVTPEAVIVCRTKIYHEGVWQWNAAVTVAVPRETWLESLAECDVTPEYDRFTREAAIRLVFGEEG